MNLIDLFCCAGGASQGYADAGFDKIIGVDIEPQPNYPFEFIQGDWAQALDDISQRWRDEPFAVHASPPCQAYSQMTKRWGGEQQTTHPDLIAPVRERLLAIGAPFVIENVMGARRELVDPVMLCGSMFGLGTSDGLFYLQRHRVFEVSGFTLWPPASCNHSAPFTLPVYGCPPKLSRVDLKSPRALAVYGNSGGSSKRDGLKFPGVDAWSEGMGIDWMHMTELREAIPPAYTKHIGGALLTTVA